MVSRPSSLSFPIAALRVKQERRASWILALGLPIVFLHRNYQPTHRFSLGSTDVTVALSDLVVLTIVLSAAVVGARNGLAPLQRGRWLWLAGLALLVWTGVALLYGNSHDPAYPFGKHLVTALKEVEYFLLAPAAVLLVRGRRDLLAVLAGLLGWSVAMSAVGLLQFLGLLNELTGNRPGQREPSYVGIQDFSALSAAALALALIVIALGERDRRVRQLAWLLGISGGLGVALAGSLAGVLAIVLAAAAAALVACSRSGITLRRVGALAIVVVAVGGAATALRSASLNDFLRFLGLEQSQQKITNPSYPQRTVLAYIGARIFLGHPLIGVGWQGSAAQRNYAPYLPDARKRFPDVAPLYFPSPAHSWGVQNAYLQTAADMGVVGLMLLLTVALVALRLAAYAVLRAPPQLAVAAALPLLWLLVVGAVWNAIGIVAGLPLDALTWLAAGLAVASLGVVSRAEA
ncbi:MAG: O-antigen ligase family protein [Gaiellaceae bacterium]